ncbi:MAG: IS256 family transposase [Acidobacteria bacterium]|nr:IS256 family transposase [Acidobacteriota bacterium]
MRDRSIKQVSVVDGTDREGLVSVLAEHGQLLVPLMELIEQSKKAWSDLIEVTGRAAIEAVLRLSAEQVTGPKHQGKRTKAEIGWYGKQRGRVCLSDRKLAVERPRLRRKNGTGGEVEVPLYQQLRQEEGLGDRMMEVLMRGVSTRHYAEVLPAMADTVGIARSSVSRKFIQASARQLKAWCERPIKGEEILAVYIDGVVYGTHHVIGALGVDEKGHKHVLGIRSGATENATVVKDLLQDLVDRGLDPTLSYLFVIDGSKALRKAITEVFGSRSPVQRCRNHKVQNVVDHLPEEHRDQVKATMRAAYRLSEKEGMARLRNQARWLEKEYPSAAASLLEGLEETFTVNRLGFSEGLRRCLGTTNIIESPHV